MRPSVGFQVLPLKSKLGSLPPSSVVMAVRVPLLDKDEGANASTAWIVSAATTNRMNDMVTIEQGTAWQDMYV